MSIVTNIILTCSSGENTSEISSQLAGFTYNLNIPFNIVCVDDKKLPKGWYGGTKYIEGEIFIGAYNHLNLDEFVAFMKTVQWESPQNVRLFVKEQNDLTFKPVELGLKHSE
jgi:hypothetical protein